MSKAAKQSIFILILLLIGSLVFSGLSLVQKNDLEKANGVLQGQLREAQKRDEDAAKKINEFRQAVEQYKNDTNMLAKEKADLLQKLAAAEGKAESLSGKVTTIEGERDKWRARVDEIRADRDKLMAQLNERPASVPVVAPQEPVPAPQPTTVIPSPQAIAAAEANMPSIVEPANNEEYWAGILKQKMSLELELKQMQQQISDRSLEIVTLKQSNDELKIEIDNLARDREQVERDIQHKEDLINGLSLELARTKNDKKYVADREQQINKENTELRNQIKQLVSTKRALEKSILRLTQEKSSLEGKIGTTEEIVQSKIDEIWEIKESLDRTIRSSQKDTARLSSDVELSPIVVSAESGRGVAAEKTTAPGFDGKVVSVNDDNHFVIVNLGTTNGVRLGETLSVFRGSQYIARLEVIQVRKDICAADVKDQTSKIKAGDSIR